MGSNFATDLASGEYVHTLDQQLAIHFSSNCYPPVPQFMVEPAIKAINAINEGDYDLEIDLPSGVLFRGAQSVSASNIVDSLRLDAWINEE